VGTGWLAPVLVNREPGRQLQCINTACARNAVSVWPKEFACLLDCDQRSLAVCMTVSEGRSLVVCLTVGGSHSGNNRNQKLYHNLYRCKDSGMSVLWKTIKLNKQQKFKFTILQ
jgi:hypothetical protein